MNTTFIRQLFGYGEEARNGVNYIASALQVSEYEVFHIAHRQWFDFPLSKAFADFLFRDYLKNDTIPFWVNDFVRKAVDKFEAGKLNPADYEINTPKSTPGNKLIGWLITGCLALLMAIYCYILPRTVAF